jgi:hypothetical protein
MVDRPLGLAPRFRGWWSRLLVRLKVDGLAKQRAMGLLRQHLSPAQREQLDRDAFFDVIGGTTGKHYRVRRCYQMNVDELDANGRRVRALCFLPAGRLPIGDIMLAQKLALELFEMEALKAANKIHYGRLATALVGSPQSLEVIFVPQPTLRPPGTPRRRLPSG